MSAPRYCSLLAYTELLLLDGWPVSSWHAFMACKLTSHLLTSVTAGLAANAGDRLKHFAAVPVLHNKSCVQTILSSLKLI